MASQHEPREVDEVDEVDETIPGRSDRPNVLFIITDQHRADHVGFGGNAVVRTPNLDSLAARGMVFDNAWVSNPICMPNRSTLMTGRMPSAHGVIFNDRSLDWGANTYVRRFREAGYRTALLGKSHLQHGMSRSSAAPIDQLAAVDDPHEPGWNTLEDFERYLDDVPQFPDSFYGFDHVELAIDHGARITGHHLHWALDRGGRYEDLVVPLDDTSPAIDRHDRWWQVYRPPYGPELHSSSFVADRTISFIEEAVEAGDPWLAWASFPDPHHPMSPPGEWFDRHDPADIELPTTVDDPLIDAPRNVKRIASIHPSDQRFWVQPCGVAGDHDLLRAAIAATYGAIELIDDRIGTILATLDRLGQLANTIVVFTTDHGDMMGDHGLLLKGQMHYQGTLRTPLVIADPRRSAARTGALATSVDMAPTLLEMAGLTGYTGMQGHSLVPTLDDPTVAVRSEVLVEDDLPTGLATGRRMATKVRTLVADGHRYTRYNTGDEQLFDLVGDPDELNDLKTDQPALRAEMIERLTDVVIRTVDEARGAPLASGGGG
jgi:arylsulfatase A-like enzyme